MYLLFIGYKKKINELNSNELFDLLYNYRYIPMLSDEWKIGNLENE